jgi:GR25 family glycosyltransferase involved in LPS biosynthesis
MPIVGRYINMDASVDRRAALEDQFQRFGVSGRYTRFAGVNGHALDRSRTLLTPGELGCFMSHYRCILETDAPDHHIHVVEDDVVFAPQTSFLLDQLVNDFPADCDLMFTDIFVPGLLNAIYDLVKAYRQAGMMEARRLPPEQRMPKFLIYPDLRGTPFGATASYLVNSKSRDKVIGLLEAELAQGPTQPIDMIYRALANQGRLTARCAIPFLTSVDPAQVCDNTITGRLQETASAMAFYVLRAFFFIARDDARLMEIMRQANAGLADPDYMEPLIEVFRFVHSERFEAF